MIISFITHICIYYVADNSAVQLRHCQTFVVLQGVFGQSVHLTKCAAHLANAHLIKALTMTLTLTLTLTPSLILTPTQTVTISLTLIQP